MPYETDHHSSGASFQAQDRTENQAGDFREIRLKGPDLAPIGGES